MQNLSFAPLQKDISEISALQRIGYVIGSTDGLCKVSGLSAFTTIGDVVEIDPERRALLGEVVDISAEAIQVLPDGPLDGIGLGASVRAIGPANIRPDASWVGRIVDSFGAPIDGLPLPKGIMTRPIRTSPPPAAHRNRLGQALETGIPVFNTFLPIVRGQRIGLFAGSGVGKSSLLAMLARRVKADYVVIGLIGERGREVLEFVEDTLGAEGLAQSVVVAETSDRSAVRRRRAAWTAMAVAEHLRDEGAHVLFLLDSLTRFCEAHREVASSAGNPTTIRGFPASTSHALTELCERAGPGHKGGGDITAVMSVLVAGSDMEEPVADMARGVLDGHIVLDRSIAERGRFPAIDILGSVSRSFLGALDADIRKVVRSAKQSMSTYSESELMIQTGLYQPGTDASVDEAIKLRPKLESFLTSELDSSPSQASLDQERLAQLFPSEGDFS